MRASEQTIQFLTDYYAAIETNRPEDYSRYYAEDMTLTFANYPTIKGRDQVVAVFGAQLDRAKSVAHELVNVWEEEGGVVIFETISHWNLHDGTQIPIPAVGVVTVVDGRFTDQRIFVDDRPLAETA